MASGKTHDIINLAAFPVFVYYLKPESFVGFFAGYMIGTFFLSPDNDIFHSIPNKRWKFLRFIWKPYTILFSHRGLSHIPIIGMLLKLLYLLMWVFILLFILLSLLLIVMYVGNFTITIPVNIEKTPEEILKSALLSPFSISFLVGLFLSEIVHILTDIVYSSSKKLIKIYKSANISKNH
ncbi:MAG: hypothetical protein GXO21_02670 [Aquificae bacterium]|nr:hypothetical protein [Aquificota bacterium]